MGRSAERSATKVPLARRARIRKESVKPNGIAWSPTGSKAMAAGDVPASATKTPPSDGPSTSLRAHCHRVGCRRGLETWDLRHPRPADRWRRRAQPRRPTAMPTRNPGQFLVWRRSLDCAPWARLPRAGWATGSATGRRQRGMPDIQHETTDLAAGSTMTPDPISGITDSMQHRVRRSCGSSSTARTFSRVVR